MLLPRGDKRRIDTRWLYTVSNGAQIARTVLWMCFFSLASHGDCFCLRPVYMRSLFDLPFLEALYEARVGLDAGPVFLYKGKRELV